MTEQTLTLAPFYKGWREYQQHLVGAIAPLTPEQLALEAAPHLRPAGLLAAHIVSARAGWFYYVLEVRDERLPALADCDDPEQPLLPAEELVQSLETTWQVIEEALDRWTPANLDDVVWDMNEKGEKIPLTRQWVLWHLIEHDLHHGGELSYTLGMHGLPAIVL